MINEYREYVSIPARYRNADWQMIVANSGYWFAKDTMRFFSSRIAWGSLTRKDSETFLFISSEESPYSARRYSLRQWTLTNGVDQVGGFQEFATLAEAKAALKTNTEGN